MALLPYSKSVFRKAQCYMAQCSNVKSFVRNLMSKQLVYTEFGDPLQVVKLRESAVPPLGSQDVLVRMLAAPVNPADINTIQGKNVCLPRLPTVAGDEGIGEVVEIGGLVCTCVPGQRVVLSTRMLGSWRYYGIYHEREVHVVSPNLSLPEGAMLTSAPSTAYRLLKDFRHVKSGETVAQTAANGPCGQCVIQLCKACGINTFNIVPNRCDHYLIDHLYRIGATSVVTLEEAENLSNFSTSLTRPVLALNCLGGRFEDVMLKLLDRNGTIIYYGDAFCLPLVKQFLRYDVTFAKFHLKDWDNKATPVEKDIMFKEIIQLMITGNFEAPLYQSLELKNYVYALRGTSQYESDRTYSYIFDLTLPC